MSGTSISEILSVMGFNGVTVVNGVNGAAVAGGRGIDNYITGGEEQMAAKLTRTVKENIARQVVTERLAPMLLEEWEHVKAQFTELVKGYYADFDWDHVAPFYDYINWQSETAVEDLPSAWKIQHETFRRRFDLPCADSIKLGFKYPSKHHYATCLPRELKGAAMDILRPYMTLYFRCRQAHEDVEKLLWSVSTAKQLEELAPELVEFIPRSEREATKALVSVELISRVRGMLQDNKEETA
jgi:hypothetical protein